MCSSCRQRGPGPSRAVVSWGGGGSALSPLGPAGGRCCRETTHSSTSPPQHPTLSRLPHPTLSHPTLSPTARPTRVSLCLPGGTGLPSPMAVLTHTHTRVSVRAHTQVRTCRCAVTPPAHTPLHRRPSTQAVVLTHKHTLFYPCTHVLMYSPPPRTHTRACSCTQTHLRTHTQPSLQPQRSALSPAFPGSHHVWDTRVSSCGVCADVCAPTCSLCTHARAGCVCTGTGVRA